MKGILIVAILFVFQANATNYYVSSSKGNDANDGLSQQSPFKTLQKAANSVDAGDTVLIMNGTYTNSDNKETYMQSQIVLLMKSGKPNAWITFKALEGHRPVLKIEKAFGFRITSTDTWHPNKKPLAYIRLQDLTLIGNAPDISLCDALKQPQSCENKGGEINWDYNGSGISIGSEDSYAENGLATHHIEISGCSVSGCAAAGISVYRADYITISNCKVFNNGYRSVFGSSGIHIYNPRNSVVVDEVEFNYIIKNNIVFNNRNEIPFYDGKKCKGFTDGNGIIIDDSRNLQTNKTAYTGNFLVENNMIYDNGGSGISLFQSDRITLRHNTVYQNCQFTPDKSKRAELLIIRCTNVAVNDNIFSSLANQKVYATSSVKALTLGDNVFYDGKKNRKNKKSIIRKDPLFKDTPKSDKIKISCSASSQEIIYEVIKESRDKDFSLQAESPAILPEKSIKLGMYFN